MPQEVAGYGVKFGPIDTRSVLIALLWMVLYFLGTFVLYAFNDFLRWYHGIHRGFLEEALQNISKEDAEVGSKERDEARLHYEDAMRWTWTSRFVSDVVRIRGLWDLIMPLFVAGYAIFALWTTIPPKPHP